MIRIFFTFFAFVALAVVFLAGGSVSVHADDDAQVVPVDEKEAEDLKDLRAEIQKVHEKMFAMMESFDSKERLHYRMMYSNHNLIETVKVVKGDISNAVKECGKNNPDMKDRMKDRFKEWTKAIDPVIKDAEASLENMIIAQDYAPAKDIRDIFKTINMTREKSDSHIEKIPVTTPEACEFLLEKMNETQEDMVKLLEKTLVTFAQRYPEDMFTDEEDAKEVEAEVESEANADADKNGEKAGKSGEEKNEKESSSGAEKESDKKTKDGSSSDSGDDGDQDGSEEENVSDVQEQDE